MKLNLAHLLSAAALAGASSPISAAAQTVSAHAHGATVGVEGLQKAQSVENGADPRTVALQSIQSGDIQLVPGDPSSPTIHLEASVLGSGSADFGTLSGSMQTQARNQAGFAETYTPYGEGFMQLSFADSAVVTSSTLALGTPVSLNFYDSLASSYFTSGDLTDGNNFAIAEFDGEVQDQTSLADAKSVIVNGSSGSTLAAYTFTLQTAVGRVVSLNGFMDVRAEAYVNGLSLPGDVLATSAVDAAHTAHFYYEPTGDLSLVSASGHDYTAPEAAPVPEASSLVSLGLLLLGLASGIAAGRRRRIQGRVE